MKKIITLLSIILVFGCKSDLKPKNIDLADLNLILTTNEQIDSVLVMDIGQNRENFKVPFKDTIRINFKDSINDLYNILFYKNGEIVSSPMSTSTLWLDGKNIIIKGRIDKKLILDTIIGTDLDYKVKNTQKEFQKLYLQKADSITYDSFILKKIKENFLNPYSLELAGVYMRRNQNNSSKLKELFDLINGQNELLKNHVFFNIHSRLINRLKLNNLDMKNYNFYSRSEDIVQLDFDKSQTYLIDIWFVNCPPCIRDHKIISKKADWFKKLDIEIVGISIDKNHSVWENYLKTNNYNWRNFREIDSSRTITKDVGISSYPSYLIIENGGEIKVTFNSFEEIEKYLNGK